MNKVEVAARSQKQALERAAEQLSAPLEELTVIEEYDPDDKDLKLLEDYEAAHPDASTEGEPGLYVIERGLKAVREQAQAWIQGLIERFQPGATCEIEVEDGQFRAMLDSEEPSILIGKQGQTLAALQHVVNRIVPRLVEGCPPVLLDTGDYRTRKEEKLEQIARRAARMAVQRRRSQRLLPMNSVDRKFIHNLLKDTPGIRTESTGRDPDRCVTIFADGGGNRGGGGGRGGRRNDDAPRKPERMKQPPPPQFEDAPNPETEYEEIEIEDRQSLLPKYDENSVDENLLREDRPFVDELE